MSAPVVFVIGTRPEAIKLAPLARSLNALGLPPALIFTGQHPLDPAEHRLEGHHCVRLCCPGTAGDPHAHVGRVSKALLPAIVEARPELVVVQGDTASALGGTLAAGVAGVPVAHVEAGLRSHDRRRPWPEEEFRVAIDYHAQLLFAPTELSAANLRRERVRGHIHVTGNTGVDALLDARESVELASRRGSLPRLLVTCHRRENWGAGIRAIADGVRIIASEGLARVEVILHPNPALSQQVRELLGGTPGIGFRHPCDHMTTIAAMLQSDLVLSDSGGMQEEAAVLGVPLLVLRDRTERPEAIATGNIEMVGIATDSIVKAARRRLKGACRTKSALPFGDGRASDRIAAIVVRWLEARAELELAESVTA